MKKPIIISCAILCVFICFVVYILHQPPVHLVPDKPQMASEPLGGFKSFDEMQDFLDAVYNDPNGRSYQKYAYGFYSDAEHAANLISRTKLPCVKKEKPVHSFSSESCYSLDGEPNNFRLSYYIDGVKYVFTTNFDDRDRTPDGNKWMTGQPIGSTFVDLYEKDGVLTGGFYIESVSFEVCIHTDRIGDVNLEQFEFATVTQYLGKE